VIQQHLSENAPGGIARAKKEHDVMFLTHWQQAFSAVEEAA
jgi:hypothetical protein